MAILGFVILVSLLHIDFLLAQTVAATDVPSRDFNEICHISDQCTTPNAACREDDAGDLRCLCIRDDYVYHSNECVMKLDADVKSLAFTIRSVTTNSIDLRWYDNPVFFPIGEFDKIQVGINPPPTGSPAEISISRDSEETSYLFLHLMSGTLYNVSCWVSKLGVPSKDVVYISTYTQVDINVTNLGFKIRSVTTNSIDIRWYDSYVLFPDGVYDKIRLGIYPSPTGSPAEISISRDLEQISYAFLHLMSGTLYNVSCWVSKLGVPSKGVVYISTYTQPTTPNTTVLVEDTQLDSFIISWLDDPESSYTHYHLTINASSVQFEGLNCISPPSNVQTCEFDRNPNIISVNVTGLNPGTFYNVTIQTMIGGQSSEPITIPLTCTRPTLPDGKVTILKDRIKSTSFVVVYDDTDAGFYTWSVDLHRNDTSPEYITSFTKPSSSMEIGIKNLTSGSRYYVNITTHAPCAGFTSNFWIYGVVTRPSSTTKVKISKTDVRESTFNVTFETSDGRFDMWHIDVYTSNTNKCQHLTISNNYSSSDTVVKGFITVDKLTAATEYQVSVYTSVRGLESENNITETSFTAPGGPIVVQKADVEFRSIVLDLRGNTDLKFTNYYIEYYEAKNTNTTLNVTIDRTLNTFNISSLSAGTLYVVHVYTLMEEFRSEEFKSVSTYTKPAQATSVQVHNRTAHSIEVIWSKPSAGGVDNYTTTFSCTSPNPGSDMAPKYNETVDLTTTSIIDLDPGTKCDLTITSNIGDQSGEPLLQALTYGTLEENPDFIYTTSILAGVSLTVAVILIIMAVAILMKRRNATCFANDEQTPIPEPKLQTTTSHSVRPQRNRVLRQQCESTAAGSDSPYGGSNPNLQGHEHFYTNLKSRKGHRAKPIYENLKIH